MEQSQIENNIPIINKLLLPFNVIDKTDNGKNVLKKTIIETTISNVLATDVDECIVVLGHFAPEIRKVIANISDDRIKIIENENIDVGLSKSLLNGLKHCKNDLILCLAGDQPTISTNTYKKIIDIIANSKSPNNTVSILRRRESGILDSPEGLGMPFAINKNALAKYLINENDNLNPIIRKIFKDDFCFYGVKEENNLELININDFEEYNFVLNNMI